MFDQSCSCCGNDGEAWVRDMFHWIQLGAGGAEFIVFWQHVAGMWSPGLGLPSLAHHRTPTLVKKADLFRGLC